MKEIIALLKETFTEWQEDKASRLAAALAYYTIFALPPLLLIAIGIAGFFLRDESVQADILAQIEGVVGPEGQAAVEDMLESAAEPTTGLIATIVGVVTLLLGAAGLFGSLQGSLNMIWEVAPRQGGGIVNSIVNTVKNRFLAFLMVLGVGFLLIVSLVLTAILTGFGDVISDYVPASATILEILNLGLSFVVVTLAFAAVFKVLPETELGWRDVLVGAAFTAFLFVIGKFALGFYLGRSSTASAYGAAGSLVLLLVWIYYSAQIFFLGAEFTQVYARRYGKRVQPTEEATRVEWQPLQSSAPERPAPSLQQRLAEVEHRQPPHAAPSPDREGRVAQLARTALLYGPGIIGFGIGMLLGGLVSSQSESKEQDKEAHENMT